MILYTNSKNMFKIGINDIYSNHMRFSEKVFAHFFVKIFSEVQKKSWLSVLMKEIDHVIRSSP